MVSASRHDVLNSANIIICEKENVFPKNSSGFGSSLWDGSVQKFVPDNKADYNIYYNEAGCIDILLKILPAAYMHLFKHFAYKGSNKVHFVQVLEVSCFSPPPPFGNFA